MKKVIMGLAALLGLLVLGVIIYQWPATHRYRMTVEVETPQGLKSASSVIEVKVWREIRIFPGQHLNGSSIRGEAVAVDLPQNQTLFVLLISEDREGFGKLIENALGPASSNARNLGSPPKAIPRRVAGTGGQGSMSGLPMLVRFRDLIDPGSVERVEPSKLHVIFGAGVELHRVTVQVTADPITTRILSKLPWLPRYRDRMLDGNRLNISQAFSNTLATNAFLTGEEHE